jgi:hypothetical protein
MLSASQLTVVYCVGGAMLGLWTLTRFPRRAPTTVRGAFIAVVVAMLVMAVAPVGLDALITRAGRTGGLIGLLLVVLPSFASVFWAAACLFRAFQRLMTRHG